MDVEVDTSLVEEFRTLNRNDTEITQRCTKIAEDIRLGSFTLVQLVEQLKNLLIDPSPENRELGMLILSQVLELLPQDHLIAGQLNFISAFYADRLNDHHQVIPAVLKGILALMKFENVPEGATGQILGSLFKNVPCQQQQQGDRYNIYRILEICLEKRNTELQQMGFDFIYGVISAMDGERDPRNLLFLFNWLPKFLKSYSLGHLTEEMFEVMACYFPVDFRAPPQDPNSINRELLATALGKCLCAVPQFAEYCLPLVLEKLMSSLRIAKLDSLEILAEGCRTFDLPPYIQHSTDIWSQIQREVLNCSDEELGQAALKTLEAVISKLSQSTDDIFKRILSDITDTLKGNLLPHLKLFTSSCKMLFHVARASKASANYMISEIAPILINTYNITMTTSHQVLVFRCLIDFVRVYIEVHQNDNISEVKELAVVPNLCLKAALYNEEDMRATGLMSLSLIAKSLPLDTRKCFYENLCIFLISPQAKIVRDALLHCFKVFAQTYSGEVQSYVLSNIKIGGNESLPLYLTSVGVIADQKRFTEVVLPIFINYCLQDVVTAEIATECLRNLLEAHENHHQIQSFLAQKGEIVNKLISRVLKDLNTLNVNNNKSLLKNVSSICKSVIGYQETKIQYELVSSELNQVVALYRNSHSPALIIIFEGLLTRLRKDVKIECDILDDLLDAGLNLEEGSYVQQVALELLANILNKSADGEILEKNLSKIASTCSGILNSQGPHRNVISVLSWTSKALVMRGHEKAEVFTNRLLELLEIHEEVAKGFKIIISDDCPSLSSKSYCNKKLLYRQKFFTEVSTNLVTNYKEANTNYLLAIGYLLQEAPKQAFLLQFNKILKLVVLCLEQCQDGAVLCAVLDTLCNLIQSKEALIEEHIQEFLPRFLKLSSFESSMQVRIKALQCIQQYTDGYPLYKLLPHKQDVVQSLTQCLDDKKRLVRKEAVEARLRWFMLDAPT